MTYQYSDIDQHEALYSLARRYPGGIDALAQAMGRRQDKQVSPNTLRNKLRPGIESHAMSAEEFSLVIELCEEAGVERHNAPLQAMCWRHGLVAVEPPRPGLVAKDVVGTLGSVSREFADLVAEVSVGVADGRLSPKESERIQTAALELMREVLGLSMTAEVVAEEGGAASA
ncbi:phage regulatory CII family protein [Cupriavidus respiraculi]|uniref:Uncharacterized protein n=1 Tax=Cupriavidus respiraculi TaxID=195930 RepID=A0ABN7ZE18_9BURK|nr:phage regulatory CII family protein [Cupriavidus respiraculi]CAG9184209.1 hypothetical protein LMG21510_05040 [Cupriavidus respiraculi]